MQPERAFGGFTWCQKTRQERGFANVTYSILHSQDGTLVYVNRFQEPAFFGRNEADKAIKQYSTRIGAKAQINRLPPRRGYSGRHHCHMGRGCIRAPRQRQYQDVGRREKSQKRVLDRLHWQLCSVCQGRFTDIPDQRRRRIPLACQL